MKRIDIIPIIIVFLLLIYIGILILEETQRKSDLYSRCHMICEVYNNMTFEGVKDGQCACNPSIMTRIYIKP